MARHSWPKIKAAFVEGEASTDGTTQWPTLEDVARRFAIPAQSVRRRASQDGWQTERQAFQRRVEYKRAERRSTEMANLGADLDLGALQVARNGLSIAASRIAEIGQAAQRRLTELQRSGDGTATTPAVDALELDRLSRATREWYDVGIRALGQAPMPAPLEDDEDDEGTPVEERDGRSLDLMAILRQHDLVPAELEEVIDVGSRLRDVAGNGAGPDRGGADTAN